MLNPRVFVLIVCLAAAVCFARPPKVIRIFPENGATDVPPGPCTIRILFDQDMRSGGYSICGGGENFPDIVGDPKWVGKRAFAFTARLKPDHYYTFGINSPSAKNFKSTSGEPAEVLVVQFHTAGGGGNTTGNSNNEASKEKNQQAAAALREALKSQYSYNTIKHIDWDALFEKYGPSLVNAASPSDFATKAGLLLAHAKDKHIWLTVGEQRIGSYVKPVSPNANFSLLPKLVPHFTKHNATICTGKFPDGIGYIYIDSWDLRQKKDYDQLYIALNEFANAPGLIIDVRGNGGGSEPLAQEFAGCFIDDPKLYAKHITIDSEMPGGFSAPRERILRPNKLRPQYRGKVAVLTGPVVMSSCEAFVLMMKQVPGCILVGQTTQGSSGNPQPHDLGNGVTVYLPSWQAMLPDGTCFEGKGIKPDITVNAGPEQFKHDDLVLAEALKQLRK